MRQGDFSNLAKHYHNRAGYSHIVLSLLAKHVGYSPSEEFLAADVGAGTGKLTEDLVELQIPCLAVEPNSEMRQSGQNNPKLKNITWQAGSGESTGLEAGSVNWVLMGSSFHWVDTQKGLAEFHRILKPGGYFTAIWNPRAIEHSEFHDTIESKIKEIVPDLKRVSSGSGEFTKDLDLKLVGTDHFEECIFIESRHQVLMSRERYLGAWHSVNDIQAQAGPERWNKIINMLEKEVANHPEIEVPYKTRAWTVKRKS